MVSNDHSITVVFHADTAHAEHCTQANIDNLVNSQCIFKILSLAHSLEKLR